MADEKNDLNLDIEDAENAENETASQEESPSLEEQIEKSKQDYLYLAADFENFRKNAIKERSELIKYGNERLLRELLEVVDNFERALESDTSSATLDSFKSGVEMIFKDLNQLLQRFGVREVESQGKRFDPNVHEALSSEPTNEVPVGHITQVFKKAYKFNDRLLRPAQVVVATEPSTKE